MPQAGDLTTRDRGGLELICLSLGCETKIVDQLERTVDVIMSTPRVDRHGERVELSWDTSAFSRNPVVLWAHDSRDLPLGRCENVRVEGGALRGTIRFASASANPKAEQCLQLFNERVLNSVSVGFIPHEWRVEKENGDEVIVFSKNELVELSVTPTPANPDAIARMKALAKRKDGGSDPDGNDSSPAATAVPGSQTGIDANRASTERIMSDNTDKQALATAKLELEVRGLEKDKFDLQAQVAERDAELKTLRPLKPEIDALKADKAADATKLTALEAQCKTLASERDAEKKLRVELESKTIEQEVDALVGKKITAAEKPLFVDLRKQSPDLFAKMIEQRQPMKLEESVIPPADPTKGAPSSNGASKSSDLLDEFKNA